MPTKTQIAAGIIFFLLMGGCAHTPPAVAAARPFDLEKDRLGFANETVWNYVDGKVRGQRLESSRQETEGERYMRRCFVVCRAAVQFWKFARFEPGGKKLGEEELARRIREVTRRDVWRQPLPAGERVVFPGYADLHAASSAQVKVFQENLGQGWPVYFRAGNTPMLVAPTRGSQEKLHREILADLAQGYPTIVWLINFPSLSINHAVVVYREREEKGRTVFTVYDPNDAETPRELAYDPAARQFSFQKTFYYGGGPVDARPLYRGVLQ